MPIIIQIAKIKSMAGQAALRQLIIRDFIVYTSLKFHTFCHSLHIVVVSTTTIRPYAGSNASLRKPALFPHVCYFTGKVVKLCACYHGVFHLISPPSLTFLVWPA